MRCFEADTYRSKVLFAACSCLHPVSAEHLLGLGLSCHCCVSLGLSGTLLCCLVLCIYQELWQQVEVAGVMASCDLSLVIIVQLPLWLRNTHAAVQGVKSYHRATYISTLRVSQCLLWPSGVPLSGCDSWNLALYWEPVFLLHQGYWGHLI